MHGDDGQGNVHLPPPPAGRAVDGSAAAFIIEQVMAARGEITLVPLGPLINLALALRLEPRIATHVREVVLMGGNALCPGNAPRPPPRPISTTIPKRRMWCWARHGR